MDSGRYGCSATLAMIVLFVVYVVSALFLPYADARICKTVDVRNSVDALKSLNNCTVVVGNVRIVLLEHTQQENFTTMAFPHLVEITGHLMLYRVFGLTSLGKIFPNLSVIRGLDLFLDYSLVIYDTPNLEEIGLYNLVSIVRGSIRIEKSKILCYVNTINYTRLGNVNLHYFPTSATDQCLMEECPKECPGACWNQNRCQIRTEQCHPVCAGCRGPGPNDCIGCKTLSDEGACVMECPPEKYLYASVCVTKDECLANGKEGKWFTFKGQCLQECPLNYNKVSAAEGTCKYCGDNCIKHCDVSLIENIDSAQKLRGCTHIHGSLQIKIESKMMLEELEQNLERIEEIDDYLKVYRSHHLRNLYFLKNLKVIHGKKLDRKRYAMVVHENQNLQKLFDLSNSSLTIGNGTFSFHYNPQLCLSEIEHLFESVGLPKNYSIIDVSALSNGDKLFCNYKHLDAGVVELYPDGATLRWQTYDVDNSTNELVGYGLYYIETPGNQNITFYDGRDVCNDTGWNTLIVSKPNTTEDYINRTIDDLKPYTRYAFYVKTYITALDPNKFNSALQAQSNMQYFVTLSGEPSMPENVRAFPNGSHAIRVTWDRPKYLNGQLSHYVITGYLIVEDHGFLSTRNYCKSPHQKHTETAAPEIETTTKSPKNESSLDPKKCCVKDEIKFTLEDFDAICDNLDKQVKHTTGAYTGCKNYAYGIVDHWTQDQNEIVDIEVSKRNGNRNGGAGKSLTKKDNPQRGLFFEERVDPTLTTYKIKSLQHFGIYVIFVTACNVNRTDTPQCSSVVQVSQRTAKKETADAISDFQIDIVDVYNVHLKWHEPPSPNGMVVSYNVEYEKRDVENAKSHVDCVTAREFRASGNKYLLKLSPGKYAVRMRANSLAGFGRFTEYKRFKIVMPTHSVSPVGWIIILILLFIVSTAVVVYYLYWKRRRQLLAIHLIPSINPDYSGHLYVEDEWEIPRKDIYMGNEIGQGSFGMVYTGTIIPQDRPCAIKTVNEHANINERMEFLNEACVMKSFNDAHHVVRLLGVVSRGQPPLVVMELMARGDLKSFLRSCRDSSNCITCAEMYRMAAEIADGMTYLAAKKFVHRDLAARNCMVGADHTVKIGDFGMTRDIYETDYYRKESKGLLPVRWMSPESLADGVFTTDADVWSYGIVLWEMVTLAEQPYQGLANEQVLQFVIAKGTLQRPPECPDLLYEIMQACWKWRPNNRPQFTDIVAKLENNVGQDFKLMSFYHSREGEEYRMNFRQKRTYNAPAATILSPKDAIVHWRHNSDEDDSYMSDDDPDNNLSSHRDRGLNLSSSGLSHKYDSPPN